MTARKLPPGETLAVIFILGAPQPPPEDGPPPKGNRGEGWTCLPGCGLFQGEVEDSPPSKGDLREVSPGRKDKPPAPKENGEGVSFAGGSPPLPVRGPALPGWELVPGKLENSPPSKRNCGKCLPGERISRPPPRKRGGRLIRRGKPAPAGDWETALPGWELVPGELENSPPTKGDLREVPPGGRDKPPAPWGNGGRWPAPREKPALPELWRLLCRRLEGIPPGGETAGLPAAV